MRHSDINLTMSRYTHTLRGQNAKAIDALPDLSLSSLESQQAKATGTDGKNCLDTCLDTISIENQNKPEQTGITTRRDFDKKETIANEKRSFTTENSLAEVGVEPTRPNGQGILSPQRLPFRHSANHMNFQHCTVSRAYYNDFMK